MRRFFSAASLCLGLLGLAALSGCKLGDGERCEIDSDCKDGLICGGTVAGSASTNAELVCCRSNQCPMMSTGRDGAVTGGGGPRDAGGDAADATLTPDTTGDTAVPMGADVGVDAPGPGPDAAPVAAAPGDAAASDAADALSFG